MILRKEIQITALPLEPPGTMFQTIGTALSVAPQKTISRKNKLKTVGQFSVLL
jgi:hypothetical protein